MACHITVRSTRVHNRSDRFSSSSFTTYIYKILEDSTHRVLIYRHTKNHSFWSLYYLIHLLHTLRVFIQWTRITQFHLHILQIHIMHMQTSRVTLLREGSTHNCGITSLSQGWLDDCYFFHGCLFINSLIVVNGIFTLRFYTFCNSKKHFF